MLIYILLISFVLLLGFLFGRRVVSIIGLSSFDAVTMTWIGILSLAAISTALALLGGLGVINGLALVAFVLWVSRDDIKRDWTRLFSSVSLGILAAIIISSWYINQHIYWYDSGLYHIQAVKWLSEHGYVWGLGLLHTRLGVISSWYALPAYFNHGILSGAVYALMGGVAFALALIHLALSLTHIFDSKGAVSSRFAVFAYLLASVEIFKWGIPISPTPDFPIIVLSVLIGSLFIQILESDDLEQKKSLSLIVTLLSALSVTINLSSAPLLIASAIFAIFYHKPEFKIKAFALSAIFCALVLLPNVLASWKTTGNLWYPLPLATDTSWSLSAQRAMDEVATIKEWGKWEGGRPEGAPDLGWLLPKYKADAIVTGRVYQFLLAIWGIGTLSMLLVLNMVKKNHRFTPFLPIALVMMVFFYLSAPSLRFGLGIMVWLPALSLAFWGQKRESKKRSKAKVSKESEPQYKWASFVVSAMILLLVVRLIGHLPIEQGMYRQATQKLEVSPSWLVPLAVANIQLGYKLVGQNPVLSSAPMEAEKIEEGALAYFVPKGEGLCWDYLLPCTNGKQDNIALKDPSAGIAGGFVKAEKK
jgi:hypothetical protein